MTSIDGKLVVLADGSRWRAFAPGWRLWRWLGYLRRRVVVARLPGSLLPSLGWSAGRRLELLRGVPPRLVRARGEPAGRSKT